MGQEGNTFSRKMPAGATPMVEGQTSIDRVNEAWNAQGPSPALGRPFSGQGKSPNLGRPFRERRTNPGNYGFEGLIDLLEAAERLVNHTTVTGTKPGDSFNITLDGKLMTDIRAAIAKMRGVQS